jgi:hypothetical protein
MDALMRLLLAYARRAVSEGDGFAPFGASMAPDGELETAPDDEIGAVRDGLRSRAARGELLATGICSDVVLDEREFPKAIRVELEHRDADPVTCVLPYRSEVDRAAWGELAAMPGERRTWD